MRLKNNFVLLLLFQISFGNTHKLNDEDEELQPKSLDQDISITPRKIGGQIRFEDDPQYPDSDDLSNVSLDEQPGPFRFQESPGEPGRVTFQDDNVIGGSDNYNVDQGDREPPSRVSFKDDNRIPDPNIKKKRRRRRRKPRYQLPGQYSPGPQGPLLPGQYNTGPQGPLPPGQYNTGPQGPLPPGQYNSGPQGPLPPGQYNTGPQGPLPPGQYNSGPQGPLPSGQYNTGPQGPLPPGQYNPASPGPIYPGPYNPGGQGYPGYPVPYPGAGQAIGPDGRPVPQYYRPPRRRKQSFASEALSRVVGALTSIALYDDYQCVPRLLCEAAGGGALGTSPVLDSIAGLQPLLTLLAAYNGISSSPLFVFGRAVFLGMTSKGNTASCRYAYPQCPTDPEQLVHYLNNYNGGFFRFFNSPQSQIPQNLEQFYNQLSGQYGLQNPGTQQNYGIYDPLNQDQQVNLQQNYGLYNPQSGPVPQNPDQQYGLYQPYPQNVNQLGPNNGFYQPNPNPYQNPQQSQYGLYTNQPPGNQNPNSHANQYNYVNPQKYGSNYSHIGKYGLNNISFKDKAGKSAKIEKRIQNKPSYLYVDSNIGNVDVNSKWIFPETVINTENVVNENNNVSGGKNLKFPEDDKNVSNNENDRRKGKSILFPEAQTTKYVNYYEYPPVRNNDNYKFGNQNNNIASAAINNYEYNKNNNNDNNGFNNVQENNYNNAYSNGYSKFMYSNDDEDGVQTVYIVRGNGDPNNPEIVKIRPGERLMI